MWCDCGVLWDGVMVYCGDNIDMFVGQDSADCEAVLGFISVQHAGGLLKWIGYFVGKQSYGL